ncbi:hypothetical protein GCM10012278_63380 [Nonomuraea glycinis]|uniref:Uncharacterized protein n=1 Tax=Nonomuraea glycinis TaxID=2047744 RepID=A0A918A9T6_9ACTN|nr:hypothetical protein GCM10012278_63380 [Nonomuraea glycinis]
MIRETSNLSAGLPAHGFAVGELGTLSAIAWLINHIDPPETAIHRQAPTASSDLKTQERLRDRRNSRAVMMTATRSNGTKSVCGADKHPPTE